MKRIVLALLLAVAAISAFAQTGTARTQSALYAAFCEQCGPPQNQNIRDLIASVTTGGTLAPTYTTVTATTQYVVGSGTVTNPSLAFSAETNTGIYRASGLSFDIAVNGARMFSFQPNTLVILSDTGLIYFGTALDTTISRAAAGRVKLGAPGSNTGAQLTTTQTTVPTCTTNCGTGSPTVAGTDTAGIITLGTTPASAFQVNFASTWTTAPSCIVQSALASMVVGKMPIAVVTTATTMTVTTNGTAPSTSDKYQYICVGVA